MNVTVTASAALSPVAGNGIAVFGGDSNVWFDNDDGTLSFAVVIRDAGNADITNTLSIDLTGVAFRWKDIATATFAGQNLSHSGGTDVGSSVFLEGLDLTTGQTAETSFTATARTNAAELQVQQLRFAVIPEPSAALLGSVGLMALLRRRR